jgi:tetratricopeptide (TPR) repeat protein
VKFSHETADHIIYSEQFKIKDQPQDALKSFSKLKLRCDNVNYVLGSAMCELRIAQCYYYMLQPNEVIERVQDILLKNKDLHNDSLGVFTKILYAKQLGDSWHNKEAVSLIDECLHEVKSISNANTRYLILGDLYTIKSHYSAGLKSPPDIRTFLSYHKAALYYLTKTHHPKNLSVPYNNIGLCYSQLGRYDSALYCFRQSRFNNVVDKEGLKISFLNIGELYLKLKKYQQSIMYLDSAKTLLRDKKSDYYLYADLCDSYIAVYQSMNLIDSVLKYEQIKDKYVMLQQEIERKRILETSLSLRNIEKKKQEDISNIQYITGMVFLVALLFFIVVFFRFAKQRKQLQADHLQKENEIKIKHREISELKQKVSYSYLELIEMAKKDDPLFIPVFKELYPEFCNQLSFIQPDLTITEQKICFYLKLNFRSKEIAQYTFVTAKAIQNRKNRLRKRFGLAEGSDLYEFIKNIDC